MLKGEIMEPHLYQKYIAGVYIPHEQRWVGEFEATPAELVAYATEGGLCDAEMVLISDMIEVSLIYDRWWENVRRKYV